MEGFLRSLRKSMHAYSKKKKDQLPRREEMPRFFRTIITLMSSKILNDFQ